MQTIELSRGMVALVDDADYHWLSRFSWCCTSHGYARADIGGCKVYMHRLVMGVKSEQMVDHRDGDKLNNMRSNLRFATDSQQQTNKAGWSETGYKGVYLVGRRYNARITIAGVFRSLGCYDTPQEAAAVYDRAANHFYGDFARTNGIGQGAGLPDATPQRKARGKTSRYRGVMRVKSGRWRTQIRYDGKTHNYGTFNDELDAARAYNRAAVARYGGKARLNAV